MVVELDARAVLHMLVPSSTIWLHVPIDMWEPSSGAENMTYPLTLYIQTCICVTTKVIIIRGQA